MADNRSQASAPAGPSRTLRPTTQPTQVVPVISQPPLHKIKVNPPEPFNGQRHKLRSFLIQLDVYFGFHGDLFHGEEQRIMFAFSYIRGVAQDWMATFIKNYLDYLTEPADRDDETNLIFKSFAAFKERISNIFKEINKIKEAERRLY